MIKTACGVQVKHIAHDFPSTVALHVINLSNDIEGHKKKAYIHLTGFIRELQQSQKIKAMFFNKRNITLHSQTVRA